MRYKLIPNQKFVFLNIPVFVKRYNQKRGSQGWSLSHSFGINSINGYLRVTIKYFVTNNNLM
jgi:hypothetical protein